MRGSVGSFGSPLPKSITGTPSASSRRRSSSRRTKGYVAIPVSVGEMRTARPYREGLSAQRLRAHFGMNTRRPAWPGGPWLISKRALDREPVDVDVVRPEPVAEAAVRHADGPEDLLVRGERRRQRVLDVLEEDLAVRDRRAVLLPREPREGDLRGGAAHCGRGAAPDGDHVDELVVLAGNEFDIGRTRRDGRVRVGRHEDGIHGRRRQLLEQWPQDELPEPPVPPRLRVTRPHVV